MTIGWLISDQCFTCLSLLIIMRSAFRTSLCLSATGSPSEWHDYSSTSNRTGWCTPASDAPVVPVLYASVQLWSTTRAVLSVLKSHSRQAGRATNIKWMLFLCNVSPIIENILSTRASDQHGHRPRQGFASNCHRYARPLSSRFGQDPSSLLLLDGLDLKLGQLIAAEGLSQPEAPP
jgi:hypothetical protein